TTGGPFHEYHHPARLRGRGTGRPAGGRPGAGVAHRRRRRRGGGRRSRDRGDPAPRRRGRAPRARPDRGERLSRRPPRRRRLRRRGPDGPQRAVQPRTPRALPRSGRRRTRRRRAASRRRRRGEPGDRPGPRRDRPRPALDGVRPRIDPAVGVLPAGGADRRPGGGHRRGGHAHQADRPRGRLLPGRRSAGRAVVAAGTPGHRRRPGCPRRRGGRGGRGRGRGGPKARRRRGRRADGGAAAGRPDPEGRRAARPDRGGRGGSGRGRRRRPARLGRRAPARRIRAGAHGGRRDGGDRAALAGAAAGGRRSAAFHPAGRAGPARAGGGAGMTTARIDAEGAAHAAPPPRYTVDGIRAAVAPILERLRAKARERELNREYAFDEVRALAEQRITLIGIAEEDGGAGGSLRDGTDLVIAIARADSNVAQALRSSFLPANLVASRPDLPLRASTLRRLRAGDLFASTANDRTGGVSGSVTTTIRRDGDGYVINGEKYYSTGALYASWFSGSAKAEDGTVLIFTVPVDREGVERLDDFDAIGQRLTASGTTRLVNVRAFADEVVVRDSSLLDNPWLGSFAQLYLAAVEAGIAAAALDDAIWFVREKARPIKHST